MTSRLPLFVVLLIYMHKSNAASAVEDDKQHLEVKRIVRSNFFQSLKKLFDSVINFFGVQTDIIEEKRQRVKSAFKLFYNEINNKKAPIKPGNPKNNNRSRIVPWIKNYAYVSQKSFGVQLPEISADGLIINQGYQSESHTVLTEDGYMITMQRIVPDLEKSNKRTVLIHHGLLESADDWLLLGQTRSLPYILADNGFEVWLLNARGNKYSKMHTSKASNMQDFWDFSWHEMGVYDLPAVIKYVSEITRKSEINFIGHSMGATALLVLLSTSPEYNYKLRSGILLAPLAFMYHVKGPIRLLADFYRTNGQNSLNFLGQTEFVPDGVFPEQIINRYCKGDNRSCSNPLLLLANGGEVYNEMLIEDILHHVPAGTSVKTIIHYVQLVKSGYFQMFDYGSESNMIKYGNSTPPLYNLNQVTLPIAMLSSPSDWLASVLDIQTLLPLLQNVYVHHVVKASDFGHLDFVWSPDAPELVYNFIITVLDQILPKQELFFDN